MRRNFLTALLICLIPNAIAGLFVGRATMRESESEAGFRRGIDLAGGTILVYEVNEERAKSKLKGKSGELAAQSSLSTDDMKKLAENLKRRIDPNDMKNVVVRPVGGSRVELILPRSGSTGGGKVGSTEDDIQEVKNLVRQVGVLEFRFLANTTDDSPGIDAARQAVMSATPEEMLTKGRAGLPPPAPDGNFSVGINGQTEDQVRYEWAELAPEERETYGLSNMYENEPPKKKRSAGEDARPATWFYPLLKEARDKAARDARDKDAGYAEASAEDKKKRDESFKARGTLWPSSGDPRAPNILFFTREFIKTTPSKDEENKKIEYYVLTRVSPVDSLRVDRDSGLRAAVDTNGSSPAVRFDFTGIGSTRFTKITERNRPTKEFERQMAIILDEKVVSAPSLKSTLHGGGQITGNFDMASVNRLVHILKSGALNAELKPDPVSENTIGPTLGRDTIHKGLIAVGASFGAVLAFMLVYYRFSGVVACVALFSNLLLTIGFMVAVNAAFTLPGLAGIVLMLGMAVDANVLIYERIREEREKGAVLAVAIRNGYDRAFPTIIDTHMTSIFTAIVLYTFGNDNLKGFSVSLTVGLIISLFTALYVTRAMFDFWLSKKWITQLRMHKLFARPSFDFMRIRHFMFAFTGILTLLGLGLFLVRGEEGLNVDFTQGTVYGGRLLDGKARALTGGGERLGLLELLGEGRQKERLKVKEVVAMKAEGEATSQSGAGFVYKIKYEDGSEAVVTLANPPVGATEEDQRADLTTRASTLPGLSVEQVFLREFEDSSKLPAGESLSFTVKTTEKEPDLVQAMLDRLLRDEKTNDQLLSAPKITSTQVDGSVVTLTLDTPASPKYYQAFLNRELRMVGRAPNIGNAPISEVSGISSGDPAVAVEEGRSGRYSKIKIDVSRNTEFKALNEAVKEKRPIEKDKLADQDQTALRKAVDQASVSFTARPIPDRLETFDPALAADTRNKAFYAILLSWMAILAYLWFRFGNWTFGAAAVICLIHDLCFTLGCIAICHYLHILPMLGTVLKLEDFKIDLTAVAALLTLVGYSVSDTIVVFDRIREVRGKNPALTPQMINESVNGTLSRTVLASLTVFLVVGVLYIFGGEGVHLFAFTMVIGVIVGTYSSIYIASPLLLIFGEGHPRVGDRVHHTQTQTAAAVGQGDAEHHETLE